MYLFKCSIVEALMISCLNFALLCRETCVMPNQELFPLLVPLLHHPTLQLLHLCSYLRLNQLVADLSWTLRAVMQLWLSPLIYILYYPLTLNVWIVNTVHTVTLYLSEKKTSHLLGFEVYCKIYTVYKTKLNLPLSTSSINTPVKKVA